MNRTPRQRSFGQPAQRIHNRKRNRFTGGVWRFWDWTKRRVFKTKRTPNVEITSDNSEGSSMSNVSLVWHIPRVVIQERKSTYQRKRLQDRKLRQEHFSKVTEALLSEIKKEDKMKQEFPTTEPHLEKSLVIENIPDTTNPNSAI